MTELPKFIKNDYDNFKNKIDRLIKELGYPPHEYRNLAHFLKELYSTDYIRRIIKWAKEEIGAELDKSKNCAEREVNELFIDELMSDIGKFDSIWFSLPKHEKDRIKIGLLGFPILNRKKFNDIKVVDQYIIEENCRELLKRK